MSPLEKTSVQAPALARSAQQLPPATSKYKQQARRGLVLYFSFLLPFTALFDGSLLFTQNITILFLFNVFLVMWTPTLASLAARLILREGFADISFRFGPRANIKMLLLALLAPAIIGFIVYGIAWFIHLTPLLPFHATGGLGEFLTLALFGKPSPLFQLLLMLLYLIPIALIAATSEEIGWRGYMLTRLIAGQIPCPVLISGLIWGLWHWPQILVATPVAGQPQIVTASIFLVTITGLGYISAYLRLKSGSIWPSILLHAAWNSILVDIFNDLTPGVDTSLWVGEPGLITALIMALVAVLCAWGIHRMLKPKQSV